MNNNDIGKLAYKIRLLFYNNIYSNEVYINNILNLLSETDIFSIDYNDRLFTLKIKKTNIKKKYDHIHDSIFYYNIINDIFIKFILNNKPYINSLLIENNINATADDIINLNIINVLYTVTSIYNNIVFLKL